MPRGPGPVRRPRGLLQITWSGGGSRERAPTYDKRSRASTSATVDPCQMSGHRTPPPRRRSRERALSGPQVPGQYVGHREPRTQLPGHRTPPRPGAVRAIGLLPLPSVPMRAIGLQLLWVLLPPELGGFSFPIFPVSLSRPPLPGQGRAGPRSLARPLSPGPLKAPGRGTQRQALNDRALNPISGATMRKRGSFALCPHGESLGRRFTRPTTRCLLRPSRRWSCRWRSRSGARPAAVRAASTCDNNGCTSS